ncbi:hypothetical protein ACLB2K_024530 [Fragaria x ananassa]
MFRGSKVVGNAGVDALCQSAHNLKSLHLADNRLISDHAFRAIGSSSISTLELTCCPNVTDVGLGFLANGSTSKTLRKLILQYCRGITDTGIQHLVNLRSLEHLELAGLSPDVTDIGGVAISTIQTLRELKLSNICKLSDRTVVALAENCRNLEVLVLHRLGLGVIEPVPGDGIHAFSRHKCLKYLALYHLDESDVEIVLGCPSLESLVLDKSLIGTFGLMHGNSAGRVVKFESFDKPLLHFIPTVW